MTRPTPPPRTAASRTRTADGRVMIGHVAVALGMGQDGAESIAVRQVGTHGAKVGSWVVPVSTLDAERADVLLVQCRKRAVVTWDAVDAVAALGLLEHRAGAEPEDWRLVLLPAAVREIAEVRTGYARAAAEERRVGNDVADVEWTVALPDPVPIDVDDFRRHTGLARPQAVCPVTQEVLLVCAMMTWTVQRWQETAAAWARREHLRRRRPAPGVLPPGWERLLADAYGPRL